VTYNIRRIICTGEECVDYPTAFTPNSNGENEIFYAVGVDCNVIEYHLRIFDRWGNFVFECFDVSEGWNGTYRSEDMPKDLYLWYVEYKILQPDGTTTDHYQEGGVTLIR